MVSSVECEEAAKVVWPQGFRGWVDAVGGMGRFDFFMGRIVFCHGAFSLSYGAFP